MSRKQDVEKARYWQRTICEAARSGISVREFCRLRKPGAHGGPRASPWSVRNREPYLLTPEFQPRFC
jgi:hypothetical protein